MAKLKYEFDPHNRLTTTGTALRGIRKVLEGQFKISGQNDLTYEVKVPIPSDIKAPHQLKLKGSWSLTQDHQLRFILDKWKRQAFGDQITLQGEILDVQKNSLLFAVTTKTKDNMPSKYVLELSGCWQADDHNRLTFKLEREKGIFDTLTFDGAWQIDENYQLAYSFQKKQLKRKSKEVRTLTFRGHWDIKDKARLTYVLDTALGSGFDFNTSLGIFKDKSIKYELGIMLSRKPQPIKRAVIFTGKWRLNKNIGLVFEVKRTRKTIQGIVFGAQARLTEKGRASFKLKNSLNEGMGVELELSRDTFSGDGQAFLRLLKAKQESAILAGVGFRW